MKRLLIVVSLAGLVWLGLPGDTWAKSAKRGTGSSAVTTAIKNLQTGTTKLVRGTIDVLTLKPFRQKKTTTPPKKLWLNRSSKTEKKEEKKSLLDSLFSSDKKPKRVETMKDFVGLERPR